MIDVDSEEAVFPLQSLWVLSHLLMGTRYERRALFPQQGRGDEHFWTPDMYWELYMSVSQSVQLLSRFWLCDPINHSMPGLPVHHQLPEFIQTHVHWVGLMPSNHLILCRPFLLPSIFPRIRVFSNESALRIRWPRIGVTASSALPMDTLAGSPCSPRDSQESSPTPHFKSINSSVPSFLYSLTLTSIHDHWKNHSLD